MPTYQGGRRDALSSVMEPETTSGVERSPGSLRNLTFFLNFTINRVNNTKVEGNQPAGPISSFEH